MDQPLLGDEHDQILEDRVADAHDRTGDERLERAAAEVGERDGIVAVVGAGAPIERPEGRREAGHEHAAAAEDRAAGRPERELLPPRLRSAPDLEGPRRLVQHDGDDAVLVDRQADGRPLDAEAPPDLAAARIERVEPTPSRGREDVALDGRERGDVAVERGAPHRRAVGDGDGVHGPASRRAVEPVAFDDDRRHRRAERRRPDDAAGVTAQAGHRAVGQRHEGPAAPHDRGRHGRVRQWRRPLAGAVRGQHRVDDPVAGHQDPRPVDHGGEPGREIEHQHAVAGGQIERVELAVVEGNEDPGRRDRASGSRRHGDVLRPDGPQGVERERVAAGRPRRGAGLARREASRRSG
jgi:hypothetical protein